MKAIGTVAVAALFALILGFGARSAAPTAHAEVEGTVALGCEFLADAIDGEVDDGSSDITDACNGLDTGDISDLGDALGDEDGTLEISDFDDVDLDANQIVDDGGASLWGRTYIIAEVDDDGDVEFDAATGLSIFNGAVAVGTTFAGDPNVEICSTGDDLDCDDTVQDDGDGIVVAWARDNASGDPGDVVTVSVEQESVSDSQDITITGGADDITVEILKDPIQVSGDSSDVDDCLDDADISAGADILGEVNTTIVKATVTDDDGTALARVPVTYDSDDTDVADVPDDSGDGAGDPSGVTGESVDAAAGIAAYGVVCGGTDAGTAGITVEATDVTDGTTEDDTADVNVVGEPADMTLTVSPASINCNGTNSATVTAAVVDEDGNAVAAGNSVNFSVVALGTANPINVDTDSSGNASSSVTPLSEAVAGVTVIVSVGDVEESTRVDCNLPTPVPPGAAPTATPRTGVVGPDTGNGGYLSQDGSAGFPLWTLIALGLGGLALVSGGLVTRRTGK